MLFPRFFTLACCTLALTQAAQADEQLMRSRACLSCHTVERKVVGPAFKDIAKRRASEPNAPALLAKSIREGSKDQYGKVPMPANVRVTPQEADQLAQWILGLQPKE